MQIPVVFEDDTLLVLNKPAGLVVDPADTVKTETLADILQKDFQIKLARGGIVHRLDKETSGLILVAKTQNTLDFLQAQFKERKVKKEYLALVHGYILESGKVEGSIGRNPGNREKFTVLEDGLPAGRQGKDAVTEYEPLERFQATDDRLQEVFASFNKIQMRKLKRMNYNQFTLVACYPQTGRTHQIRVHLKHINHPIVSDDKYVGRKMERLDKRWCPRLFLHAAKIGFYHPKGDFLELESTLPEDLQKALDFLHG